MSTSGKIAESSCQVSQIWALLCNWIALSLNWNCVKSPGATKIVEEVMSEEVFGELESKIFFHRLHKKFWLAFYLFIKAPIIKKVIFRLQFAWSL